MNVHRLSINFTNPLEHNYQSDHAIYAFHQPQHSPAGEMPSINIGTNHLVPFDHLFREFTFLPAPIFGRPPSFPLFPLKIPGGWSSSIRSKSFLLLCTVTARMYSF